MNLSNIYSLRQKFTIIAITGRTGSGCTEIAKALANGFVADSNIYPQPEEFGYGHNAYRKYRVIYDYASENFKNFELINYKDILVAFILKYDLNDLISFLKSEELVLEFKKIKLTTESNFAIEIDTLRKEEMSFNELHEIAILIINDKKKSDDELKRIYQFFNSKGFKEMSDKIHSILKSQSIIKRNKTFQILSNNLRKFGHPYGGTNTNSTNIFVIAEVINDLIKSIRKNNNGKDTKIVIDSLRNPFEIMFFKQRFTAFYVFAINRKDEKRKYAISKRFFEGDLADLDKLIYEEHYGGKSHQFYKQNVSQCIENADIHIAFSTKKEATKSNDYLMKIKENASPYFSWGMQLLKFVSLIDHPGLITPTPEERCMQLAYTAKYNSGCISRQVGAAVTDSSYSIKSIGWNNTPEGQVPCNLRYIDDLINENKEKDFYSFTPYERTNKEFKSVLIENYKVPIEKFKSDLKGRNVCFCFKSLINSYSEGKNQVHTRSLHAEESAFLQISKYGGIGLQNGKLFTTASPCELCSKKAYQLGIKVIYYIDPYPGISKSQILEAGKIGRNPRVRLFDGAIGNSYHSLYEPFMSYKDELALILELDIKDLTKKYKEENVILVNNVKVLQSKVLELQVELDKLKIK